MGSSHQCWSQCLVGTSCIPLARTLLPYANHSDPTCMEIQTHNLSPSFIHYIGRKYIDIYACSTTVAGTQPRPHRLITVPPHLLLSGRYRWKCLASAIKDLQLYTPKGRHYQYLNELCHPFLFVSRSALTSLPRFTADKLYSLDL